MSLPDIEIVQKNLDLLRDLDDNKLIMLTLSEICAALAMGNNPGIPPGKSISLSTELARRTGVKF